MVTESARRCLAAGRVDGGRVAAVCVTGQWASTVPVDAAGRPVGPCLMWSDTEGERRLAGGRRAATCRATAPRALATWVRRTAGVPSTSGADPVGHMLHLQLDEPAVAAGGAVVPRAGRHLALRFSGVAAASPASMTAAWLTDNRHPERLGYDATLVRRAGLDADRLPPLVATGSVVAPVLPEVAADLGISPDAVVVTGVPDLHAAALGSGLRPRPRGAPVHRHHRLGELPAARQADRPVPADGHGAGPDRGLATCWATTRRRPGAAWSGSAASSATAAPRRTTS